jgi:hypothetical protein
MATTTDFPTEDRRTNCSTKYSARPANRIRYTPVFTGPSLRLREMAVLKDSVDLQGKMRLELFALRIGETDIGKDVAGALFEDYVFLFFRGHG